MTERVLTVRDPWAHAIFAKPSLRKTIENRTWRTDHRGRIAIHVAQKIDPLGVDMIGEVTAAEIRDRGHVIGTVEVESVHIAGGPGCGEAGCFGNPFAFRKDPANRKTLWHWVLRNPRPFITPIASPGRLQLWEAGPTLSGQIRDAEVVR